MLCWALILFMSGRTKNLKSTLNDRFLKNFSWQFYFTLRVSLKKYFILYELYELVSETRVRVHYPLVYIHNWPLQPCSQNYGLASHTTHAVCVNFIREWRNLQFNVDSVRQIFSWQFYLLSEFLTEICWEEVAEKIFFHISFSWSCMTWGLNYLLPTGIGLPTRLRRLHTKKFDSLSLPTKAADPILMQTFLEMHKKTPTNSVHFICFQKQRNPNLVQIH